MVNPAATSDRQREQAPASQIQSLGALLADVGPDLTPTERRLAELIEGDPTIVAFDTVAELADRVGTSGPTIMRFAAKLGFNGYSSLQQHVRDDVAQRLTKPTDRIRSSSHDDLWAQTRASAHASIDDAFERGHPELIDAMATMIAHAAGRVWIVASETSSPVAQLLASNLRLLRPGVLQVTGSAASVAALLIDATANDLVIAIDVARYEQAVIDTSTRLAACGAAVVAITDGPLSPLAAIADRWCGVAIPAVGPFDSAIPIVAIAELLTASVANQLHDSASARLDLAETTWRATDVFATDLSGDR
jgi:DNA-binding MurR/RpiR family transcriptional regulator